MSYCNCKKGTGHARHCAARAGLYTKAQAKDEFARTIGLSMYADGSDKPAIRAAWVDYIDTLHRAGQITSRQAGTWTNPLLSRKDR